MYLKSLTISRDNGKVIRNIPFHIGLNLIVDETPTQSGKETGNNVGKTTVLKLIDFCLGGESKSIYTDHENKRTEYKLVKDYLVDHAVLISLVLKEDLSLESSREFLIERNFLPRKEKIQRIDGKNLKDDEFEKSLTDILFPDHFDKKPTFRQIISHNIRHSDPSTTNTLKTLNTFTRLDEYETLHLFIFGCDFDQGGEKQRLRAELSLEESFKKRLEREQTKSGYETALALLQSDIVELEHKKSALNLNPNFESDLDKLNDLKYQVNSASSDIGRLEIRKELILEAQGELASGSSTIDLQQLHQIYEQATTLAAGIKKTFNELHDFHNRMVRAKLEFLEQDLPKIEADLTVKREALGRLLAQETELSVAVTQSDSFEDLERLIAELTTAHQKKGQYENSLRQLNEVDEKLTELGASLLKIDNEIFSDSFGEKVKEQVNKFNKHFSAVSQTLYGEKYALKADVVLVKGRRVYQFTSFNTNMSSGKKLGEISCFDIAYTLFADEEKIPCMHFLLNDKKELMHGNQLLMISNLVNSKRIQLVASILKDKLPSELNKPEFIVLKLSQEDKLFRIEA